MKNMARIDSLVFVFLFFPPAFCGSHNSINRHDESRNRILELALTRCAGQSKIDRIFFNNNRFTLKELKDHLPDRLSGIDDFRKVVVVTDEQSRTLPQLPRLRNVQVTTDRSLAEKTRIHVVISKIWFLEDSKAALVLQKSDTEKNEHTTELLYYEKQTDSQEPTGLGWKLMQSKVIASSARRYEDYEEF